MLIAKKDGPSKTPLGVAREENAVQHQNAYIDTPKKIPTPIP
jgi:hypothetical protein